MIKYFVKNNNTNYEKTILVVGVFHGDEPQGEYLINEYLDLDIKEHGKNCIVFVPRLNKNCKRQNINGVDLNRNFPTKNWELTEKTSDYYGGESAGCEEETKFMVDLIDKYKFDSIISIHAPFKIVNYDCGCDNKKADELAKKISDIVNYPVQKDIGYPTPGSFGTYCGVERNIPTITIEVDEEVPVSSLKPSFIELFHYLEFEF